MGVAYAGAKGSLADIRPERVNGPVEVMGLLHKWILVLLPKVGLYITKCCSAILFHLYVGGDPGFKAGEGIEGGHNKGKSQTNIFGQSFGMTSCLEWGSLVL